MEKLVMKTGGWFALALAAFAAALGAVDSGFAIHMGIASAAALLAAMAPGAGAQDEPGVDASVAPTTLSGVRSAICITVSSAAMTRSRSLLRRSSSFSPRPLVSTPMRAAPAPAAAPRPHRAYQSPATICQNPKHPLRR